MPTIMLETRIQAPIERVFDLERSIDLHQESAGKSRETAVGGVTSGLIGPGDEVSWRARHFGIWQKLTVRITEFDRPRHFADEMVRGAFKRMRHEHFFEADGERTLMRDVFVFESPMGPLGKLADLFLAGYMRRFLMERNEVVKRVAESDEWKAYLDATADQPQP